MSEDPSGRVPFHAYVELLQSFLANRNAIVEQIEGLLNAQRPTIPRASAANWKQRIGQAGSRRARCPDSTTM
jgi:hypothetical protein